MSAEVLVVAEHRRGVLLEVTREAVTAATELKGALGGRLTLLLVAPDPSALVSDASLVGVDEIIQVPVDEDEFGVEAVRETVEAVVRQRTPAVVAMGFTPDGLATTPGIAVHLGLGFASDVVACSVEEGRIVALREYFGGKVQAELILPEIGAFLLLRPTIWPAAVPGASPVVTEAKIPVKSAPIRVRHRSFIDPPKDDIDISRAEVILAVGRGVGEEENVARLRALAKRMNVTLAASRPLVDAGWLPQSRQVGQSGVTVRPKLYLAFGISGAAQHVAGMRRSKLIVAVNDDARAPIFNIAQLGAVADLFDIVDELESLYA